MNFPRVGDTIQCLDGPQLQGKVIATFYQHGEGGMHVAYAHGNSWTCCHRVKIIGRAK